MAQGWNFGEVILQAINAQQERSMRKAMQERAMTFEDAQGRKQFQERKVLEADQQGYRKELQELEQKGKMTEIRTLGKQTLDQIARRGNVERDNLLVSQEPVDAEQLEAQYKGTRLEGKFRAAANAKGQVTYHDRALLLGLDEQQRQAGRDDMRFKLLMDQATRDYELAAKAIQYSTAKEYKEVPEVARPAPARGLLGFISGAGSLVGNPADPLNQLNFSIGLRGLGSRQDQIAASKAAREAAIRNNEEATAERARYVDESLGILEKYKNLPLTPSTTASVELGTPVLAPAAEYDPLSPVVRRGTGFLTFGRGPLLPTTLTQQFQLMRDAENNRARMERDQMKD